ncbi:transcription factor ORG2-like [Gastrolobium bilobum]|uniref:transcription factor ORG2-like n=1 Tax=Gastrolobium bilobum TaxID=150636 RepID=UPI002AB0415D|nr:transcription factor ORG2-like [Gastrolobium bilobum]
MLAISTPPLFSNMGWNLEEEPLNHKKKNYYKDTVSSEYSISHKFSSPQPRVEVKNSTPSSTKKVNHNARERDRRKKINNLIFSLRSLLPVSHQKKKMSIPETISRVITYVPELQQHLEGLIKKKEELLSRISQERDAVNKEFKRKIPHHNSAFVVSTTRLNDNEAAIQICSQEVNKTPLSDILLISENNGLSLLNASSSETFGGRVFYNLHFQVDKTQAHLPMLRNFIKESGVISFVIFIGFFDDLPVFFRHWYPHLIQSAAVLG